MGDQPNAVDQTHIVIRLRKFSEIGDPSLPMIRRAGSTIGFTMGAVGWAILNTLLLGWIGRIDLWPG